MTITGILSSSEALCAVSYAWMRPSEPSNFPYGPISLFTAHLLKADEPHAVPHFRPYALYMHIRGSHESSRHIVDQCELTLCCGWLRRCTSVQQAVSSELPTYDTAAEPVANSIACIAGVLGSGLWQQVISCGTWDPKGIRDTIETAVVSAHPASLQR